MADDAQNKLLLPLLLSLTAGYVDTAGFLALQGLFTAHVTGNFVTLGASLALGTSGAIAKLLALPTFCAVVIVVRLLDTLLSKHWRAVFEALLGLKVILLIAGAVLAIKFGPFQDGDKWQAILTGMVLVSAMAIQNAVHRIYLGSAPPSTLMTGTTTQIMIDLADLIRPGDAKSQSNARLARMFVNVLVFALGCGAAALLFMRFGVWCFALPPILGGRACREASGRVISPASQSGRRSFATRSGRRETDMLAESVLVCNDPKDTMIRGIYVRLDRCQAKGAIKRWDVM